MRKKANLEVGEHHEFAARLERALLRVGADMSIREKGEVMGLSKTFTADILAGRKLPSAENILKIATITGVRADWLWTGRGLMIDKMADGYIRIEHLSPEQQRALQIHAESYNKPTKE